MRLICFDAERHHWNLDNKKFHLRKHEVMKIFEQNLFYSSSQKKINKWEHHCYHGTHTKYDIQILSLIGYSRLYL